MCGRKFFSLKGCFFPFPLSPSLARFQRAMGGIPAWADLENRKKSKKTASDSKETHYCSDKHFCVSLFSLLESSGFWCSPIFSSVLDRSASFLLWFNLFLQGTCRFDVEVFLELAFPMCSVLIRWQWWRWWSAVQDWQFHIKLWVLAKRYFEGKGKPVFPPPFDPHAHLVAIWEVTSVI